MDHIPRKMIMKDAMIYLLSRRRGDGHPTKEEPVGVEHL